MVDFILDRLLMVLMGTLLGAERSDWPFCMAFQSETIFYRCILH